MKCFLVLVVIATTSVTSRYVHKSRHQLRSTAANTDTLSPSERRPKSRTSIQQTLSRKMETNGTISLQPTSDNWNLVEAADRSNSEPALIEREKRRNAKVKPA